MSDVMEPTPGYKSGFVSIIGRPNVGKSTLLNRLVGEKVAIVSNKPQTTRTNIQGIRTDEDSQIVFIDTPGFHSPRSTINKRMVQQARDSLSMVDIVYLMVQPDEMIGPQTKELLKLVQELPITKFLIINKVDAFKKHVAFQAADRFFNAGQWDEVLPVSAKTGINADTLIELTKKALPEGRPYFDEEEITTQPEKMLIAEFIREQVFHLLSDELPYDTLIETEKVEDRGENLMYIAASIIVSRSSQKGIVIGKQGSMLKIIGERARMSLQNFFGINIYLDLWVKIRDNWSEQDEYLRIQGLE